MSDTYSVIYSPEAMDDLREIYLYIAFTLKVPDTAEMQVNCIRKEIRSLDFMPSAIPLSLGSHGRTWECTKFRLIISWSITQ